MDVTGLAIAVTVALGVGIVLLLVVVAVYLQSRRRVDKLRHVTAGRAQRRTVSSQVYLPDDSTEALQARRRTAAVDALTKFVAGYRARQLYNNISMLFLFSVKDGKLSTCVNATFNASCYG